MPIHNIEGIATFDARGPVGADGTMRKTQCHGAYVLRASVGDSWRELPGGYPVMCCFEDGNIRIADSEEESARIASVVIVGKVANCRTVLQRAVPRSWC